MVHLKDTLDTLSLGLLTSAIPGDGCCSLDALRSHDCGRREVRSTCGPRRGEGGIEHPRVAERETTWADAKRSFIPSSSIRLTLETSAVPMDDASLLMVLKIQRVALRCSQRSTRRLEI